MSGKSLMTQYIEGAIVGRELREMLASETEQARFDRELADELDFNADLMVRYDKPYHKDGKRCD